MKKRYFIIGLAAILALPALAELTVDDTVSKDYLHYHGHSRAIINTAQKNVAQTFVSLYMHIAQKTSQIRSFPGLLSKIKEETSFSVVDKRGFFYV